MGTSSPRIARLHTVGLAVFFVGFAVFVATLGLGKYRVTAATVAAVDRGGTILEHHRGAVLPPLEDLEGREFWSIFSVIRAVDEVIDTADASLGDAGRIWDFERGEYRFAIVREASLGIFPGGVTLFFWLSIGLACLGAFFKILEHFVHQFRHNIAAPYPGQISLHDAGIMSLQTGLDVMPEDSAYSRGVVTV